MIGMFWVEKYVMVSMLTMMIRKLYRFKGNKELRIFRLRFGLSVIAMNLGAGMLYPYSKEQYLFGIAEGVFAGSTLAVLRILGRKVFKRKRRKDAVKENFSPGEEKISHYTKAFTNLAKACLSVPQTANTLAVVGMDDFQKVHAVWNARMEEQRVAVAAQLTEVSDIMEGAMRRAYDTKEDTSLEKQLKAQLHKKGILLKQVYVYDNQEKRKEVYLTIRSKRKKCISNREAADVLSRVLGMAMMPSHESRAFVRNEYTNTCFVERTNFEVVYGVERCVGDYQQISGDSISLLH